MQGRGKLLAHRLDQGRQPGEQVLVQEEALAFLDGAGHVGAVVLPGVRLRAGQEGQESQLQPQVIPALAAQLRLEAAAGVAVQDLLRHRAAQQVLRPPEDALEREDVEAPQPVVGCGQPVQIQGMGQGLGQLGQGLEGG